MVFVGRATSWGDQSHEEKIATLTNYQKTSFRSWTNSPGFHWIHEAPGRELSFPKACLYHQDIATVLGVSHTREDPAKATEQSLQNRRISIPTGLYEEMYTKNEGI